MILFGAARHRFGHAFRLPPENVWVDDVVWMLAGGIQHSPTSLLVFLEEMRRQKQEQLLRPGRQATGGEAQLPVGQPQMSDGHPEVFAESVRQKLPAESAQLQQIKLWIVGACGFVQHAHLESSLGNAFNILKSYSYNRCCVAPLVLAGGN
ncbi:hypothetical protein M5D96_006691 [Drosophila gunungcola]|uniref:Uncharacterized protein n=1 Tax=Drosophila gunungcola TaxID=103775 RepID=A0A9Q0BLZ8_9MUSC|nr:hypothetical protein M5D96_010587 [Drosophila gunungcola]KAI8040748.1 hypothetical protein M5D96_006691 [Drosophila gunungcola]